jgi:hypothetical protein
MTTYGFNMFFLRSWDSKKFLFQNCLLIFTIFLTAAGVLKLPIGCKNSESHYSSHKKEELKAASTRITEFPKTVRVTFFVKFFKKFLAIALEAFRKNRQKQ